MCGIMAAITENVAKKLYEGLKLLEYRGYDFCGIAIKQGSKIKVIKKKGQVKELENFINISGESGIAHTRWATHGEPSERNAHPIFEGDYAVVHNGIIENYIELKKEFNNFNTDTDTEVIVKLLNAEKCQPLLSLKKCTEKIKGSFAIAVISTKTDEIYLARNFSPIYLGISDYGVYAMSDVNSLKAFATKIYELKDGEFAKLTKVGIEIFTNDLIHISRNEVWKNDREIEEEYFTENIMEKEIKQSSLAIQNTLNYFYSLDNKKKIAEKIKSAKEIVFVACGTAYHACLIGERYLEEKCNLKSRCFFASEFCDEKIKVASGTVVIALSQSGETADTVLSVKKAKEEGAYVVGIINTENSYITKIADDCIYTKAGVERAVAATKSFICQVIVLYLIACEIQCAYEFTDLNRLPLLCDYIVGFFERLKKYAKINGQMKEIFLSGVGYHILYLLRGRLK